MMKCIIVGLIYPNFHKKKKFDISKTRLSYKAEFMKIILYISGISCTVLFFVERHRFRLDTKYLNFMLYMPLSLSNFYSLRISFFFHLFFVLVSSVHQCSLKLSNQGFVFRLFDFFCLIQCIM